MSDNKRVQELMAFNRVLNTPDGKMLMEEIKYLCDGKLMGVNPETTAYNVGRRDVYKELLRLQEAKHDE